MVAAIVVDKNKVVCVTAEPKKDGTYTTVAEASSPFNGFLRGESLSQSGLGRAVEEAVTSACGASIRRLREVYVGVSGKYTYVEARETPYGEDAGLMEDESQKSNENLLLHKMEYQSVVDNSRGVSRIWADLDFVDEVDRALAGLNIGVTSYISQNYAEGMFIIPEIERDNVAIMINLGYYYTDICVFVGDAQVYQGTLMVGGLHLVRDLSMVLEIDLEYAEQLKRQFVFGIEYDPEAIDYIRMADGRLWGFEHGLVDEVIVSRLDEIISLMRQAMEDVAEITYDSSKAYFVGSGVSDMRGAKEYIGAKVGLRFENLPLFMVDGSSRYSISAMAALDYAMTNLTQETGADGLQRILGIFRKK